jgi:SAM-dependent methyltransferase
MSEGCAAMTVVSIRRRFIWSETLRGKSIGRTLLNWALQEHAAQIRAAGTGIWLDLAGGKSPSYHRVMGLAASNIRPIMVDINTPDYPGVVADLNQSLPFKYGSATVAILANALYIFREPQNVLDEAARVLKPGGLLVLVAPLVSHENPEPHDYWRFTSEALQLMLDRAGFDAAELIPIGERWTTVASLLSPFLHPRFLRAVAYLIADWLDGFTARHLTQRPCPMAYLALARKPLCI